MRAVRSSLFAVTIALLACRGKTDHDSGVDGSAGGAGTGGATAGTSGSSGTAGGNAGVGGAPANTGSCEPSCASKADCCTDCTYPNNLDCVDRHCVSLGCTGDADCTRVDGAGTVCRQVLGVPRCIKLCGSDTDCNPPTVICAGRDDQGNAYCGRLPGLIRPCATNTDCTVGVCDPTTRQCGCSSDGQCQPGLICVPS